jgi:putative ABC transport system ATP-binding protein
MQPMPNAIHDTQPSNTKDKPRFLQVSQEIQPVIRMKGINYAFGRGESRKQVLFDNQLTIYPGEIVFLTGPSGSGKTTLLTLIGALRSIQEGSMRVLDQELAGMAPERLQAVRRDIGFIFQAHNLFDSLTAFQTLELAMRLHPQTESERRTRPQEMLAELGLADRMHYKPEKLSGGQQQRVAIGRALINHPRIILADEPTAALDKDTGRHVVTILRKRAREEACTILIVTHDNRILDVADRILRMVDGIIVSNVVVADSIAIGDFLQNSSVFKDVNPTALAAVAKSMRLEFYDKNEMVIREGEIGDRFYLVRSGKVAVLKENDGQLAMLGQLGSGDVFGQLALLRDQPRAATIKALSRLEVFTLAKEEFDAAIRTSNSFREQLEKLSFY